MELYSSNKDYKLYHGNMLDMLEVIEPNTIDSVITDPPYELNFMGKGWDNSGIAFQKETWQKCYEVLKPGGYLLAFGGSRTFHRIACAIEDAGFEIRDTIMWLYGSGFPKSMDISKQIDKHLGIERQIIGKKEKRGGMKASFGGSEYKESALSITEPTSNLAKQWQGWGTALKPSFEPIIVARKPFKGSLVDNVIEYGVGGINIDECRVDYQDEKDKNSLARPNCIGKKYGGNLEGHPFNEFNKNNLCNKIPNNNGRFPANTILTYDDTDFDEVCGGFPIGKRNGSVTKPNQTTNSLIYGKNAYVKQFEAYNDSGSASRYFMNCKYTGKDEEFRRYIYTSKASKKDRDEGLDKFEEKKMYDGKNAQFGYGNTENDNFGDRVQNVRRKNTHPTVKPTELMQYLVRLVSPNGATILDCFNGSGSTGKAVMYENKERNKNYKYIGIELTEEYLPISKARIECLIDSTPEEPKEDIPTGQTNIFNFIGENNE